MTPWTVAITRPAEKDLEDLPSRDQAAVERRLDQIEQDQFSTDIRRVQGSANIWRGRATGASSSNSNWLGGSRPFFAFDTGVRRIGNSLDLQEALGRKVDVVEAQEPSSIRDQILRTAVAQ